MGLRVPCWLLSAEQPEVVNSLTGASEALLEDGVTRWTQKVSEGTSWMFFEARMMGRAACAALDHVATQAMFSCDSQVHRWSVLDFFCAKLLSLTPVRTGVTYLQRQRRD